MTIHSHNATLNNATLNSATVNSATLNSAISSMKVVHHQIVVQYQNSATLT